MDLTVCLLLCSVKTGKVVIVLNGRFAGRKAVVVKASESGSETKKFGHALGRSHQPCEYRSDRMQLLVLIDTPERLLELWARPSWRRETRSSPSSR